jgi:transcriptional regulator with XRE-family HTH domain
MSSKKSVIRESSSESDFNAKFGERFRLLRKELNLNQEVISKEFNVGKGTVSEWENGKYLPPITFILEFSRKYGVNILWLLEGGDQPKFLTPSKSLHSLRIREDARISYGKIEDDVILKEVIESLKNDRELLETVWHLIKAQQGIMRIKGAK